MLLLPRIMIGILPERTHLSQPKGPCAQMYFGSASTHIGTLRANYVCVCRCRCRCEMCTYMYMCMYMYMYMCMYM